MKIFKKIIFISKVDALFEILLISPTGVFLESPTDFTVDARSIDHTGDGKLKCILTNPQGTKYDTMVDNHKDGTYGVTYTPFEQGTYLSRLFIFS